MSEESEEKNKKINWSPEKVMSISALFVSVVSVVALLYQLSLSREENALIRTQQSASVRPHLTLTYTTNAKEFKMTFINKGVGPAFVKGVKYQVSDSLSFERSDFFFNYINRQLFQRDGVRVPLSTYSFMEGDVITANSELNVLTVMGESQKDTFKRYLDSIDWSYNIIYEDIYGARWSLTSGESFPVPIPEE